MKPDGRHNGLIMLEIAAADFKAMIGIIDKVPAHNAITSSQFVKIQIPNKTLTFQLSGLAAGVSHFPVSANGGLDFYIDRRVLSAFASIASSTVKIEANSKGMLLRSGRGKLEANTVAEVSGYCDWSKPKLNPMRLDDSSRRAIATASLYAPQSAAADHLSCVYLASGAGILSTDQHSVFYRKDTSLKTSVPLPLLLCALITDNTEVTADNKGMRLRYAKTKDCAVEGQLYQTVSSRCTKNFPLDALIKNVRQSEKTSPVMRIAAKRLSDVVAKLKTFIFGPDDSAIIVCSGKANDKHVTLSLESVQGLIQERVNLEAALVSDVEFRWVAYRLITWSTYLSRELVVDVAFDKHVNVFRAGREMLLQAEVSA